MASFALLFAVGDAASLNFADDQMRDFFELWGWTVTVISDEDTDLDSDSFLEGFDVVVFSESCSSSTLGSAGDTAAVGLMDLEPGHWDDIRLTNTGGTGSGRVHMVMVVSHESSGGIAGSGSDNQLTVVTTSKSLRLSVNAAVGGAGGTEVGILNVGQTTFAFWETGENLDTGTAPARRGMNGLYRISPSSPDETVSPGFVNNDLSWLMFASQLEWLAGHDPTTDQQIAFPVTEVHRDAAWSADSPTDIDDVTPVNSTKYTVTDTGVIVFRLGNLTDPATPAFHHLAMALRRSVSAGTLSGTMTFNRNWVSEASPGTEVQSVAFSVDDGLDHGGVGMILTESQADTIVGSEYGGGDLYARVDVDTRTSPAEAELVNLRFTVGAAPDADGLLPIYRRNVYHQSRRHRESQVFA